jgi:hypothetical protein
VLVLVVPFVLVVVVVVVLGLDGARPMRMKELEACAPKGLKDSAQGFNPGKPQNKQFALKGLETIRVNLAPITA